MAHCETREIIEIFHRFRPIVQIFYTRAVHTVRSAQNLSHSSSSPSVCFSASSSYQSPARRRCNTSETTSQQRRYSTESTLHCRGHKSAPNSKGLTAPWGSNNRQPQKPSTTILSALLQWFHSQNKPPTKCDYLSLHTPRAGTLASLMECLSARSNYPFFHSNLLKKQNLQDFS